MPGWSQRPLFKNPTNMMGGGYVGMPKGISGYVSGGEVKSYEQTIAETAKLFAKSDPDRPRLLKDYESNLHWHAKNIAGGHRVPKEQVMQDLAKAIETQRGAPKMMHGGIVGLENGGMAPALFEGEEIVETNPMLNQMAGQGGSGIASVSAEPAPGAAPERNVPNERGIIELAMDTEEAEDDEPIIAFAKQEAQGRLSEEFNILRSTAQAEAATGNPPSAVIKSSMDDLARSARRIENETVEKYPEVPANANLISSDDLIPYREELVAIFETPEVGSEEPLMDTAILAKRGGLIPRYQDGGEVPDELSWIDPEILAVASSVEDAEALMIKKYGPDIVAMRKLYATEKDPRTVSRRAEEERKLPIDELIKRRKEQGQDTRIGDLIADMESKNFMGSTKPDTVRVPSEPGSRGESLVAPIEAGSIRENMELIKQYQASQEEFSPPIEEIEVTAQKRGGPGTVDQGLSFQDGGQDIAAILKAAKEAGYSEETALELIRLMQQGDPFADVKKQAETLKGTYEKGTGDIASILDESIKQYEKDAKKQDKDMRNIFDDIEQRIPEQAKYAALTSAASSAGGKGTQYWTRKFNRKGFEQNLHQTNNKNKIEFENLRKQETEARRDRDVKALYDIKLKQHEILSNIDKSMLDAEAALAQSQIENQMAIELEELKVELGTGGTTYGADAVMAQREKSDNFSIEENMTYATRQYGAAYGAERYNELSGEKTVTSGGVSKQLSFPEFYRQARDAGKTPKDIIEDWVNRP